MGSRSFTRSLTLAFTEWLLMLMLFLNSIFSYIITRFAEYSNLQSPCLICSRLDHILGGNKSHWNMICPKHISEISSLVYCHVHSKLVDVHGICETCLLSFATINKSNYETYRLSFGKFGEDSCFGSKSDDPRYCTCCNQLLMSQTTTQPDMLPKKHVSFNQLPQVGYSGLKIQSEAVFSEDEGFSKEEDHKFQTTDKLINLDLTTDSVFPEHLLVNDVSETLEKVLKEEEILSSDNIASSALEHCSDVSKEKEELIHLQDISSTLVLKEDPANASLMEETELICLNDVISTSDPIETPEDVIKGTELMSSLHDISVPESFTKAVSSANSMPEISTENSVSEIKETKETSVTVSPVSEMASPAVTAHTEAVVESDSGESCMQGGELLNLADAYNIIVSNEGKKYSIGGSQVEKWMKKDSSRVSEDLKALLTQISASRGIEFMSPRNISSKMSLNSTDQQEIKNIDYDDMQLLLQRRMLERNESNLSLEGVSVLEIEGESESDRLRRQVDHDRKLLTGLIKELEEERSASAIATNQAMAMITKLQEEKALFQMEALQNLRMMEEQSEYDIEAIQKLNDLVVEREKVIQDLEAEIEKLQRPE